jgi:hypothetical protein
MQAREHETDATPYRRARHGQPIGLVALALFLGLLTAWLHQDVLRQGGAGAFRASALWLEQGDQLLHAWTIDWVYHQLRHDPLRLFAANTFHPQPHSLALSDHLVGVALTLLPLRSVVDDPLRLNALGTLLTFILAGTAVGALVVRLTGSLAAAGVAGTLYAFNPFRAHNLSQIQLLADYAMPLAFLYLHRYRDSGRSRDLVLVAVAAAWQVLCGTYLGAYLIVALVIVPVAGRRRGHPAPLATARAGVLALLVGGLVLGPFVYPYLQLRAIGQLSPHVINSTVFSLGLGDFLCWRDCQGLFGPPLVPVTAMLAAAALWPRWPPHTGTYLAITLIGWTMALGPYLHVAPTTDLDVDPAFLAPGPYWFVQHYVPGFDGLRVPARAVAVSHLALAVLAGLGVARLMRRVAGRVAAFRGRGGVLGTVVLALVLAIVVRTSPRPSVSFEPVAAATSAPPVYAWLAASAGDAAGAIVELPVPQYDAIFMYRSRLHRRPLVNGYSGFLPYAHRYVVNALRCYPCLAAQRALADLDVRTHVLHLELFPPAQRAPIRQAVAGEAALHLAREFGDTLVIASRGTPPARPAPAILRALSRNTWRATSSRGPRGVERAIDASPASAWTTAEALEDLRRPWAGLLLLREQRSWRDIVDLVPRGDAWFGVDLGTEQPVRRVSLAFSELGGPPTPPAPAIRASADGTRWFDLPSDATVEPSVRALFDAPAEARFVYDWPPTTVRHIRVHQPGYWSLRDIAVFE